MSAPATGLPPVSVVVPTHHRPALLRDAVRSVLDQDYAGDVEVLVVLDACELDLADVHVPDRRTLRVVPNERTRGLAGARNTGVLAASHELVAFLDDDDTWDARKLAPQVDLLLADPAVRLVGTAMRVDDGHTTRVRLLPRTVVTRDDLVRDRLAGLHSSSFLFRRRALVDEIGLVDEDLPGAYGEDYDLLLRTSALGPVAVVNEPLVTVRWQGQSHFFGRWDRYAQALTYLLEKHPEITQVPAAATRVRSQVAFALAACGRRAEARRAVATVLRRRPADARAWLALLVSLRLVSGDRVGRVAQRLGRGV